MPLQYEPKGPPNVSDSELQSVVQWLFEELQQIANLSRSQEDLQFDPTNIAPTKPTVSEVRWADGTNWNPGGGAGLYEYTGAGVNGWRMLASGTQY